MEPTVGDTHYEVDETWKRYVVKRDPHLRERLILRYVYLVRFVVGRLGIPSTTTLDLDDLMSYGTIGLINAIDRFEPERGVKFEAYASARIRGAVIDQLRALNWLPRSAMSRSRKIESTLASLEQRLGRPALEDEVAAEVGVSVERYRQMLVDAGMAVLSLDAPLMPTRADDDSSSLGELIEDASSPSPVEEVERHEVQETLEKALNYLPERERTLLNLYYVEELTMKEISVLMGVSESRVCQLHSQALLRLRGYFHARVTHVSDTPSEQESARQRLRLMAAS